MLVMLLKGRASLYHGPKRPITIFEAIFPKMKCFLLSRFGYAKDDFSRGRYFSNGKIEVDFIAKYE